MSTWWDGFRDEPVELWDQDEPWSEDDEREYEALLAAERRQENDREEC